MHIRRNPVVQGNHVGKQLYAIRSVENGTSDVTFKIGTKEIRAHKCVMAALSPKYMAQFYSDYPVKDPVEVNGVSAAAFEEFLQFFYLDEVKLSHENIEDVLTLTAESLETAFDECFNYIADTLSIENVCRSYHLAVKYNKVRLIEQCERKISNNSDEVFLSNEFLDCNQKDLFNILSLDSLNCKETDIFKAAILWARKACINSGWDPEKMENLRKTLIDLNLLNDSTSTLLYQIRFGMMTLSEFMNCCYKQYKELFTEDEREEIFYMIAKDINLPAKRFNNEPRIAFYQKWDDKNLVECNRITNMTNTETFRINSNKTTFTSDKAIILGGFHCGNVIAKEKCVKADVTVVQKQILDSTDGKRLYRTTEKLTFKRFEEASVRLHRPIMIWPSFVYEIHIDLKEGISVINYQFKETVPLIRYVSRAKCGRGTFGQTPQLMMDNLATVVFHDKEGLVTRLLLNPCNEQNPEEIPIKNVI